MTGAAGTGIVMRIITCIVTCTVLLLSFSCKRRSGSGSFDGLFAKLSEAKSFSEIKRYYTSDTVDAIEDAERDGLMSDKEKRHILPLFDSRTEWEESGKKVRGDRGVIRVRYTEHPVENMIGFEMEFNLVREGGSWRIDLEDEVKHALKARRDGRAAQVMQRIRGGP